METEELTKLVDGIYKVRITSLQLYYNLLYLNKSN